MIELYHWEPTADSLKLLIALKEKNIPFQSRYVDLLNLEHHAEAFKAVADVTRVPLMVQDGEAFTDSQLTLEYLAEAFEPRLAPSDPTGWYDVQAWTAQLDQALASSDWLVGGAYSVVDINAFALTHTLPRLLPELVNDGRTPKTMAWLNRIGDRPAVKAALAMGKLGGDAYAPLN